MNRSDIGGAARMLVIKIGSAVLTDSSGLCRDVLNSLASQITTVRQQLADRRVVVVSSGAVAAGKSAMNFESPYKPDQTAKQALAAIGQARLMHAWSEAFRPVITAQALLTRADFKSRERFQHAADTFAKMLAWDVIPIVNENDTVAVHELRFGDNDTLASLLVNLLHADLFINLTSAPGVFAANPEKEPEAQILAEIDNIQELDIRDLCGEKTASGSGGMHSKLLAARRVAQLGVPTLILPGREPDILLKAFGLSQANGPCGTFVDSAGATIPRRKYWLAYQSEPDGSLEIDQGAAGALQHRGASLLPGGIIATEGEFQKGALVRIIADGQVLALGFTNYDSAELRRIQGLKRHEIAAILGTPRYPDAIHRDNLLLDPAV